MPQYRQEALDHLRQHLLGLSALVETSVAEAFRAVKQRDAALAQRIIAQEEVIDSAEVELEKECLQILALHTPVAIDLRFVIAVVKVNSDLERIADLAKHIAEQALVLAALPPRPIPLELSTMAELARTMLRGILDALVAADTARAREVWAMDDTVDALNRKTFRDALALLEHEPAGAHHALPFISVARHLERIADHATNIAEDVIYVAEGDIVRHHAPGSGAQTGR